MSETTEQIEVIERLTHRIVQTAFQQRLGWAEERIREFHGDENDFDNFCEEISRSILPPYTEPVLNYPETVLLEGTVDYRVARILIAPDFAVPQALYIDSKAEKRCRSSARLQTSQTSMDIMYHNRKKKADIHEHGKLPKVVKRGSRKLITTSVFVKYDYDEDRIGRFLRSIIIITVPNGLLQAQYNPDFQNTIWSSGPSSEQWNEKFRVRINFKRLRNMSKWERISILRH